MASETQGTKSIWGETGSRLRARLVGDLHADVCIVGAGIAGLTTAYLLASEGKEVVVLDDGPIGSGETSRTTAHLVNALDHRYSELEKLHRQAGARLAAESHTEAIKRIESIIAQEKIDCDFTRLDGYLFLSPGETQKVLDEELTAAHRAGLTSVTKVEKAPLVEFDTGPCLLFPHQAQFHPMKYLNALVEAIECKGGKIFNETHAETFEAAEPCRVTIAGGAVVTAASIIVATNTPVNDWITLHTKQAAYRSYVVALEVPVDTVAKALYWDTADPFHYVRLQGIDQKQFLIVGGEDHKAGQADNSDERFARLETWARERFPSAEEIAFRWSGQVMESMDGLAFIGRNPGEKNVYVVTGDSGNGMTHGTIAGVLLADLILGRANPWQSLYDPARISLRAAGDFAKENLNVAAQFVDYITPADTSDVRNLATDSGALIREGLTKVAVYCDANGGLHKYSAICPHLGCVVNWNTTEKTWDCPCHGSRFDPYGKLLSGPANSDLPAHES